MASQPWRGVVKLAVGIGIAYFLAGRLGLVLRVGPGIAVFWPAAGIAVGALIALGSSARLPVAAAVVVATTLCNLMIGRNAWLAIAFGSINAGQTLFTAWLLERWFGSTFKLEDVQRVLGFLGASAVGSAIAAVGAAIAVSLINPTASPLQVWRLWFAACSLGIVTVAPLLISLGDVMHERPTRHELIEGWVGIVTITALCAFTISLPDGPWAAALPEALVFPFLLWIAIRCRPVFAAAAAFVVGLTVIGSTTLDIGHFDASKPFADRILAAQTFVLAASILAVLLAALFAERRRNEVALKDSNDRFKDSNDRLQLALDGARLGVLEHRPNHRPLRKRRAGYADSRLSPGDATQDACRSANIYTSRRSAGAGYRVCNFSPYWRQLHDRISPRTAPLPQECRGRTLGRGRRHRCARERRPATAITWGNP